jgi:uncharacterized protein (DUF433 family)
MFSKGEAMRHTDIYGGKEPGDIPNYSYTESARLSGVPYATLRSWVHGRQYPRGDGTARFEPLIELPEAEVPALSYNNIIEAHVLSVIRHYHKLELKKVRAAIVYAKEKIGVERPLIYNVFKTDGVDLFVEHLGDVINASRGGQMAFREIIEARLSRIDYGSDGKSIRLFPFVRNTDSADQPKSISIDPRVSFGKPVIAGTGIPVANIVDRLRAGDSITDLEKDYQIGLDRIEDAIRYELKAA